MATSELILGGIESGINLGSRDLNMGRTPETSSDGWDIESEDSPPQKLGGVLFWMTGGLAIIKDLVIDTGADWLIAFGTGESAVTFGVGAIIGVPIAVLAWSANMLFAVTVWLIMWVYFYLHGGIHTTVRIKRLVIWGIGIFTETLPIGDLLPMTTIMFFAVAILENIVRRDNLLGFAARTAIDAYSNKRHPRLIAQKTLEEAKRMHARKVARDQGDGKFEKLRAEYAAEKDPQKRKELYARWDPASKAKGHAEFFEQERMKRAEARRNRSPEEKLREQELSDARWKKLMEDRK